jgi:mannose-6-phosphate isomerase-like protein (cupin superfamily)
MIMHHQSSFQRLARTALTFLLVFSAALALARPAVGEIALASSIDDAALQWGPCPAFLPEGCAIAVLHGDPAQANVDVFFKLPGNSMLPLHWHSSAERMVLVSGELRVTYQGQDEVSLKPGMYAYGPAKLAHHGVCASAEPCVLFIAFESPLDAVAGVAP